MSDNVIYGVDFMSSASQAFIARESMKPYTIMNGSPNSVSVTVNGITTLLPPGGALEYPRTTLSDTSPCELNADSGDCA